MHGCGRGRVRSRPGGTAATAIIIITTKHHRPGLGEGQGTHVPAWKPNLDDTTGAEGKAHTHQRNHSNHPTKTKQATECAPTISDSYMTPPRGHTPRDSTRVNCLCGRTLLPALALELKLELTRGRLASPYPLATPSTHRICSSICWCGGRRRDLAHSRTRRASLANSQTLQTKGRLPSS